jgi:hypothetical protein
MQSLNMELLGINCFSKEKFSNKTNSAACHSSLQFFRVYFGAKLDQRWKSMNIR